MRGHAGRPRWGAVCDHWWASGARPAPATVIVANAEDDNSATSQYRDPEPLAIAIPLSRIGSGASLRLLTIVHSHGLPSQCRQNCGRDHAAFASDLRPMTLGGTKPYRARKGVPRVPFRQQVFLPAWTHTGRPIPSIRRPAARAAVHDPATVLRHTVRHGRPAHVHVARNR